MKKFFLALVMSLSLLFSLNSCIGTTYACTTPQATVVYQTDESITSEIIISTGIPYYFNNVLEYYLLNDRYYYPYVFNGVRFFRPFDRPFAHGMIPRFEYRRSDIGHHEHFHQRPFSNHTQPMMNNHPSRPMERGNFDRKPNNNRPPIINNNGRSYTNQGSSSRGGNFGPQRGPRQRQFNGGNGRR